MLNIIRQEITIVLLVFRLDCFPKNKFNSNKKPLIAKNQQKLTFFIELSLIKNIANFLNNQILLFYTDYRS